jgi:uncharacterized membrane protein
VARGRTLALLAAALIAAELGVLLGPAAIRVPSGLILTFLLPGLVMTRGILIRTRIEATEELLLVPGLSLAIAVITGLAIGTARARLTATTWAIALGIVIAAGLLAAGLLARAPERTRALRRPAPRPAPVLPSRGKSPGIGPVVMFAVGALAVFSAIAIGVRGQRDHDDKSGFTELWALPGASNGSAIRLGVRSHERRDVRYRIRVSIEHRAVRDQALTLRPGQTWQTTQPVGRPGERVRVALLTSSRGRVYREVHLASR